MIIEREDITLLPGTSCGIKTYTAMHEIPHFHDKCIEIVFCMKGSVEINVAYEQFTIKAGEIITIDADDVHGISSEEDNLIVSFYIDQTSDMFGKDDLINMSFVCRKGEVHPSMNIEIDKIRMLLLAGLYAFISPSYDSQAKINITKAVAKEIMDRLQKNFSIFYWMNDPNQFPDDAKQRFEHIFVHIYNDSKKHMTIKELGELEHINPNYLSQFLRKTSFMGLRGLRTYIRVYKAEILLLTTNLSAADISYQCGFSDPKYFYKGFRKWYGRTPTEHRKWYREYVTHTFSNQIYDSTSVRQKLEEYITYYQSEIQFDIYGIIR